MNKTIHIRKTRDEADTWNSLADTYCGRSSHGNIDTESYNKADTFNFNGFCAVCVKSVYARNGWNRRGKCLK